ncbi:MAG: thiopeptide-type bacteriocin biosynthesis protein [Bacteroidota bacterium]
MSKEIQRTFIAGDDWLYFKIYGGPHTCDAILAETILPVSEALLAENIITKWFFIRYADPQPHLRVRFLLSDPSLTARVIAQLNPHLREWLRDDLIWKVQTDTYQREIERYGPDSIELAEEIFYHDSVMIATLVGLLGAQEGEHLRWLFGIRAIDSFLDAFDLDIAQKTGIMKILSEGFKQEFGNSKSLKIQLDTRYRYERKRIEEIMQPADAKHATPAVAQLHTLLVRKNEAIRPIAIQLRALFKTGKLQTDLNNLLHSLIHMLMNRLFRSNNRLNEMVCYDFLHRYYKSSTARQTKEKAIVVSAALQE